MFPNDINWGMTYLYIYKVGGFVCTNNNIDE